MTTVETPSEESPSDETAPPTNETPVTTTRGRRHRTRTRSVRTWLVLATALVVAVTVPILVAGAVHTIANSKEGRRSVTFTDEGISLATLPRTPGALLVTVDNGDVVGLTVFALSASGRGGTIIPLPTGTQAAVVGSEEPARLAEAYHAGGLNAQVEAVESFLGVTFDVAAEASPSDLATLLEPYAPFEVNLTTDVVTADAERGSRVVEPAGKASLTGDEAAAVLTARLPNESEAARLDQVGAIWGALSARSGGPEGGDAKTSDTSEPSDTSGTPGDTTARQGRGALAAFLATLMSGPTSVQDVPSAPVLDRVNNPKGVDLLFVDPPAVRLLMAQVLPGAVSPPNGNVRVRLLNPSGDPSLSYAAVARLIYVGANVILASDAKGDVPEKTVIEYQRSEDAEVAGRYGPYLGGATTRQSDLRIDGVDATIVLGREFAAFVANEAARSTTTAPSTTAAPTSGATVPFTTTKQGDG